MMSRAPEWLGLICQGASFYEVEKWLEAAAEYGFRTVQPVFFWAGYTDSDFERLSNKLSKLKLKASAFGVYGDLYKWNEPIGACFQSTMNDMLVAARCIEKIDTRLITSWCGTFGGFAEYCPDNNSDVVIARFRENQEKILPSLVEHDVAFVFEPWRDHILADERMTAIACQYSPGHFKAVLDFPNFISSEQWPVRQQRIQSIKTALQSHVAIVHLKDMAVRADGGFDLPMFGRGAFSDELAVALKPYVGHYPILAEHMQSPDDLPEMIESIMEKF